MIRWKNGRPLVELYDASLGEKRYIRPSEFGMSFRGVTNRRELERLAKQLEQRAISSMAMPVIGEETCGSFARRWPDDFPGRGNRVRGESTIATNRQAISKFADDFDEVPLAGLSRERAVRWAQKHPSRVAAVRAMFGDALDAGLVSVNVFSRLGLAQSRGRRDILMLTAEELDDLVQTARIVHGEGFGDEIATMVTWAAYTLMRAGEVFATRYSRLYEDTYDLRVQYDSRLRKEVEPKYGSEGLIYVPELARQALLSKPRRLDDDLCFRTIRAKQFCNQSWRYAWEPVRTTFAAKLPSTHDLRRRLAIDPKDKLDLHELRHFGASYMLNVRHIEPWIIAEQLRHQDGGRLVVTLYGHPSRKAAIEEIRRGYGANVTELKEVSPRASRAI